MQSAEQLLAEVQAVISKAEKENRNLTADERYRAEKSLERAQGIRDKENLGDAIAKFNGELNAGAKSSKSYGAPALDFSLEQVRAMHTAAQGAYHFKADIDSTDAPMAAVGDYKLTPFPFLRDKPRVATLIPVERTDAPMVHYFRGTTAASAAAAVAEGAAKPESSPVWTQVSAPVRKLAHFVRINDEVLQDFTNFRQVIGTELLSGLIDAEKAQLLVGSGTPPNLTGLLTTAGILTRARGTDSNLDAVAKAKADLRVGASFSEPDAIVIHPTNLMSIATAKDADGRYIVADPAAPGPETLFGMRVVATTKITLNTALMGDFKEAARLYVRQPPVVEVAPLGGGTVEFIANQTLALRGEARPRGPASHGFDIYYRPCVMPRYKVAQGRELSHSERGRGGADVPQPTTTVGYEARMLAEGDEVELPEAEGERLVEAGVLEASRRRSKK